MHKKLPDFKSSRPYITVPAIKKEYIQDGVRFYLCEGARVFVADTYDLNFTFQKGKIKPKHNKGDKQVGLPKQLKGVLAILLSLSSQAQHITNAQIDQLANWQVPTIHYSKTNTYATFTLFIKNPCTGKHTWFPFFKLTDSAGNVIPSRNGPVHAYPGTFTFNYWGKRTVNLGNRDNVLVLLYSHLECVRDRYYWCGRLADGVLEEYHENGSCVHGGSLRRGRSWGGWKLMIYRVKNIRHEYKLKTTRSHDCHCKSQQGICIEE